MNYIEVLKRHHPKRTVPLPHNNCTTFPLKHNRQQALPINNPEKLVFLKYSHRRTQCSFKAQPEVYQTETERYQHWYLFLPLWFAWLVQRNYTWKTNKTATQPFKMSNQRSGQEDCCRLQIKSKSNPNPLRKPPPSSRSALSYHTQLCPLPLTGHEAFAPSNRYSSEAPFTRFPHD